jgi:flagellar assembly protein FliH
VTSQTSSDHRWQLPYFKGDPNAEPEVELPTVEEVEAIRNAAQQEGYDQGYKKGMQHAANELKQLQNQFNELMSCFTSPLEQQEQDVNDEIVKLSMAVTKQIVRRDIQQNPEQIIAVVREAIKLLPTYRRQVILQIHPDDGQIIRKVFAPEGKLPDSWIISDDPSIERGGCIVSTEASNVDATLDKRVSAIYSHIVGDQRSDSATDNDNGAD